MVRLKGRPISKGMAQGTVLVSRMPISFYGGVDPETATIIEKNHSLFGTSIERRILVFPNGKGSTVGSYILYRLKRQGKAPLAIINRECDTIVAVGAIISDIPAVDKLERDPVKFLRTGDRVKVNGTAGWVEKLSKEE